MHVHSDKLRFHPKLIKLFSSMKIKDNDTSTPSLRNMVEDHSALENPEILGESAMLKTTSQEQKNSMIFTHTAAHGSTTKESSTSINLTTR